jgi:hypothetical protein
VIAFFKRHADDEPKQSAPEYDFLSACPVKTETPHTSSSYKSLPELTNGHPATPETALLTQRGAVYLTAPAFPDNRPVLFCFA